MTRTDVQPSYASSAWIICVGASVITAIVGWLFLTSEVVAGIGAQRMAAATFAAIAGAITWIAIGLVPVGSDSAAAFGTGDEVPRQRGSTAMPQPPVGHAPPVEHTAPRSQQVNRGAAATDELVLGQGARNRVRRAPATIASHFTVGATEPHGVASDSYSLDHYEVRAASRIGTAHAHRGEPRQDSYLVTTIAGGRCLAVLVADGVGSAAHSHFGSAWAPRHVARRLDRNIDGVGAPTPAQVLQSVREAAVDLREQWDRIANGGSPRDIATTLVGIIVEQATGMTTAFRIGDSEALVQNGRSWTSCFAAHGETGAFEDASTDALPTSTDCEVRSSLMSPGDCLLLVTDGVGGPMSQATVVAETFADELQAPIDERKYLRLLSFNRRAAHDDRTAVALWRTS